MFKMDKTFFLTSTADIQANILKLSMLSEVLDNDTICGAKKKSYQEAYEQMEAYVGAFYEVNGETYGESVYEQALEVMKKRIYFKPTDNTLSTYYGELCAETEELLMEHRTSPVVHHHTGKVWNKDIEDLEEIEAVISLISPNQPVEEESSESVSEEAPAPTPVPTPTPVPVVPVPEPEHESCEGKPSDGPEPPIQLVE